MLWICSLTCPCQPWPLLWALVFARASELSSPPRQGSSGDSAGPMTATAFHIKPEMTKLYHGVEVLGLPWSHSVPEAGGAEARRWLAAESGVPLRSIWALVGNQKFQFHFPFSQACEQALQSGANKAATGSAFPSLLCNRWGYFPSTQR